MAKLLELEQIESALAVFNSPESYYVSADETIDITEDEMERHVSLQVAPPASAGATSFYLTTLTPKKGVPVNVQVDIPLGNRLPRRLTHVEHLTLSASFIVRRFYAVIRHAIRHPDFDSSQVDPIKLANCLEELRSIPYLDSDSAESVVSRNFEKGGDLTALGNNHSSGKLAQALYDICLVLASRYLIVYEVSLDQDTCRLEYKYRQAYSDDTVSWRGSVRKALRANPYDLRIHIPLARRAPHYTLSVESLPGFYFDEQRVVTDIDEARRARPRRIWLRQKGQAQNVSDDVAVSREIGRATRSFIHVDGGQRAKARLYAAYRLWELPPGITGKYLISSLSLLFLGACIAIWIVSHVPDKTTAAAASAVLGLATFVPLMSESLFPSEALVTNALKPRVAMTLALISNFLFALWVLSRGAEPRKPSQWQWINVPYEWLHWVGMIFLWLHFAILLAIVTVLTRRLIRLSRRYRIVVNE